MTSYEQPLVTSIEALRAEVISLVQAALPLSESVGEFTTEWQARRGDGVWHAVTPRQAISAHQQKLPVRSRRVTPWSDAVVPVSSVPVLRAAS